MTGCVYVPEYPPTPLWAAVAAAGLRHLEEELMAPQAPPRPRRANRNDQISSARPGKQTGGPHGCAVCRASLSMPGSRPFHSVEGLPSIEWCPSFEIMEEDSVKSGLYRHQTDVHARHRRVALLKRELRQAEAERDQSVAAMVSFGKNHEAARHEASARAIGRALGVSHTVVNAMVDRADSHPTAPAPQLVPVVSADKARAYVESGALGEIDRIIVAFNPGDVLLESGLDPSVFADGSDIEAPTLLIRGADGDVLGVSECLAGYGGTGPSNSYRLLTQLGLSKDLANEVFTHRFIEFGRDRVIRATHDGLHSCGGGLELAAGGGHFVARLSHTRSPIRGEWSMYNAITAWTQEVMDRPEAYPWVAGERRARVYLDRDAAAALQEPSVRWKESARFSVVIEQGRLQLWCSAIYPYNFADLLSSEQLRALGAADLYPDGIEPRTWLDRFLPHRRDRPPFLHISDDGQGLTHEPAYTTTEP